MKTCLQRLLGGTAAVTLVATLLPPRLMAASAIDPDADRIFHACCNYLADSKAFSVNVEVWRDVVLPDGTKIQTTRTLAVHEKRPDQLRIEVKSPHESRGFWYYDKTLTMLDRRLNLYGVMEVPNSIDKTIDAVEEKFGIEIPLGDVLVADPYASMMEHVEAGEDLGKATVLGVQCDHLAFTGPNADCQIWIADGPKPLPKKIVINLKTKTGSPQITQLFSDWDLVSRMSDSVFKFTPPDDALKIVVNPGKPEDSDDETAAAPSGNSSETPTEAAKK